MLSVWWLDLGRLAIDARKLARCLLTDDERARQERFVNEADRLRFAAGRSLARAALSRDLECRPGEVEIGIGRNGRPELVDRPDGPWFNLTHSGTVVALAVAPFPCVGIDTEEERSGVADELAAAVCTAIEQSGLAELPGEDRTRRFFELWALKEAYMKARSEGLSIDPRCCDIDLTGPPTARRLPGTDGSQVAAWSFRLWRIVPGQSLALAFRPMPGQRPTVEAPRRAEALIAESIGQTVE